MSVPSIGATKANVTTAIAAASQKTGIDFNYLLGQAQVESGLRTNARAGTSSASGLYQFIEQSWLGVVKEHGDKHGLGWASDAISRNASGRFVVSDPETRRAILSLRNDPQAASLMAAEHASDNKDALEATLGRDATGTDLYMAHFLGIGGARKFLKAMDANGDRSAAALFPAAARANRNVFYASNGAARSLDEVYQRFAGKLDKGAAAVGGTGLASGVVDGTDARFQQLVQSLGPQAEVVLGNDAVGQDRSWLTTISQFQARDAKPLDGIQDARVNPLRPTPETARLAYMMLASMGA